MTTPYILFWEKWSGAILPQAMLEEIGAPYSKQPVDMGSMEHKSAAYLEINPAAQVPALRLPDGRVMAETAAIAVELGERHPDAGLVPDSGDAERPFFLQWLMYMAANGYKIFSRYWHPEQFTEEASAEPWIKKRAEEDLRAFFAVLERAAKTQSSFLESRFSALDIYLTMLTAWAPDPDALFMENPKLAGICKAVKQRPAYRRVMEDHDLPA
jgi:glutathione S-transferase